jgi:DNA-binding protein HU-beta
MNKSDLIDAMVAASGIKKTEAGSAFDGLVAAVIKGLRDGETVSIPGFGSFVLRERAARTGRNPKTGESIAIAASRAPVFKAGKGLKDAVS